MSAEEYRLYRDAIPPVRDPYWLRTNGTSDLCGYWAYVHKPTTHSGPETCGRRVYDAQFVDEYGKWAYEKCGMRPVLKVRETAGLQAGDMLFALGHRWTALDSRLAICDLCVGKVPFVDRSNKGESYEASNLKYELDKWFASAMEVEPL